jgi:hypothetical protein
MPLREHHLLCGPVLKFLQAGERPAWEIEEELARQFRVTADERAQTYPNTGMPIWTNDVAFVLKRLVQESKIRRKGQTRAPNGGKRGIYILR